MRLDRPKGLKIGAERLKRYGKDYIKTILL